MELTQDIYNNLIGEILNKIVKEEYQISKSGFITIPATHSNLRLRANISKNKIDLTLYLMSPYTVLLYASRDKNTNLSSGNHSKFVEELNKLLILEMMGYLVI